MFGRNYMENDMNWKEACRARKKVLKNQSEQSWMEARERERELMFRPQKPCWRKAHLCIPTYLFIFIRTRLIFFPCRIRRTLCRTEKDNNTTFWTRKWQWWKEKVKLSAKDVKRIWIISIIGYYSLGQKRGFLYFLFRSFFFFYWERM